MPFTDTDPRKGQPVKTEKSDPYNLAIAAMQADLARLQKQLTESTTGRNTPAENAPITAALNIDIAKVQAAIASTQAEMGRLT